MNCHHTPTQPSSFHWVIHLAFLPLLLTGSACHHPVLKSVVLKHALPSSAQHPILPRQVQNQALTNPVLTMLKSLVHPNMLQSPAFSNILKRLTSALPNMPHSPALPNIPKRLRPTLPTPKDRPSRPQHTLKAKPCPPYHTPKANPSPSQHTPRLSRALQNILLSLTFLRTLHILTLLNKPQSPALSNTVYDTDLQN